MRIHYEITVTIDARDPKDGYDKLNQAMKSPLIKAWTSDTFTMDDDDQEHETCELFDLGKEN